MHTLRLIIVSLLMTTAAGAATTIDVSNTVTVPQVKRFGVGSVSHYYYDRVVLKNLIWRNAGFEGLLFRSIIRCASGAASGCVDDNPFTQWPTGFWDGGEFELILGSAKGRTGTISTFVTAPRDQVTGSTFTFASGGAVASGDIFIARKYTPGGAEMGWNPQATGGATITTELTDLPPGTDGRQCIRLNSAASGQTASINAPFGSFADSNFVLMNGTYRVTFKARGVGGANNLAVAVARGSTSFTSSTVPLTQSWQTYQIAFSAAEAASIAPGFVTLTFRAPQSAVLLDDVSLEQTNSDPTNTTAFTDPVIAALRELRPGGLRSHVLDLGDSLEDLIGPPFARRRVEYTVYATNKSTSSYGFHEFLELCEHVGAEPYLDIPVTFNDAEVANLMEYLGGPVSSPYGARRAARGRSAPWTDAFSRIHLEFGNEAWNPVFRGGTMPPADYGRRGHDFFGVVRSSPYYSSSKYNLILGVQASSPFNSRITHNASANHDMLGVAPYMATRIDDFESNERLFGGLFAEASWWSSPVGTPMAGLIRQTADYINGTSRPVPLIVYEVNLHTTQGAITQQMLDSFTPSLGAGLAVVNHMLIMLRDIGIRDQYIFSLGGHRFQREDGKTVRLWSITRDMGVTDRKRPQYLAARLANEALAGDMVRVTQSGDNPRWNQPLTNRIALDNIPYIQSFAFVNGSQRSIIVFNLHRTDPLQVTFTGPNAPGGSVSVRQLTASNITDTNESAENVVITTQSVSNFDPGQAVTLPPFSMTVFSGGVPIAALAKGDVNGNGNVTAFDASVVLQSVVGAATLDSRQRCAADYDGNGNVGAFDASLILQCIVGSGTCSPSTCS